MRRGWGGVQEIEVSLRSSSNSIGLRWSHVTSWNKNIFQI